LASCTNGVGTVTFSLNGSAFGVGSFTGLCDGNINITAMDANGCQVTTNTLMGAVNPSAEPNINPMASLCESGNVVNLTADIAGGTWSGLGVTNNQTGTFDPQQVGAGVYNVIYTIAGFCGGDDTIAINVVNDPIGAIELSDTLGCLPLSVNLSNPLSDASNASCIWTISNGDVINSCNAANYNFTSPGCYDVSLTITNTGGCTATFNALQQVCVLDAPDASFTSNAIIFEEGASIFNGVANDVTGETYQWYFSDLSISNTIDASHDLDGLGAGEYSICLSVGNQGGCSDSVCEIVTFVENFSIYIPNTFTPNGDGINELFYPVFYSALPENFEFLIFNRWGQLIFQSKEIDAIWDGTYNGSLAPEDVYIWKINYTLFNETGTNRQTGHVNLVR
jgi:gliding motility-associated-like protein